MSDPPTALLDPDTMAPAVSSDFFSSDWRGIAVAGLQSALSLGDLGRPAAPAPHAQLISAQHGTGDKALVVKADGLQAHDPFRARLISATDGCGSHSHRAEGEDGRQGEDTGENSVEAAASPVRVHRPVDEELLEAAGGGRLHLP